MSTIICPYLYRKHNWNVTLLHLFCHTITIIAQIVFPQRSSSVYELQCLLFQGQSQFLLWAAYTQVPWPAQHPSALMSVQFGFESVNGFRSWSAVIVQWQWQHVIVQWQGMTGKEQSTVELHGACEVHPFVRVCVCIRKNKGIYRVCVCVCFIQDLELICYIERCITNSESRGFIG